MILLSSLLLLSSINTVFHNLTSYYIMQIFPSIPSHHQSKIACIGFILAEVGNFCIHKALRDLRPAGSKVRKIPLPTLNPFTWLFRFVSCPNYSYEVCSWICFTGRLLCLSILLLSLLLLSSIIYFISSIIYTYILTVFQNLTSYYINSLSQP